MAKFTYLYNKDPKNSWLKEKSLLNDILKFENQDPYWFQNENEALWVSSNNGLELNGFNLIAGSLGNAPDQYSVKLQVTPEFVELTSDLVASRTVWYYTDSQRIIISSSQRTIINLLGNFEYNAQAASWMLCTGCIGPGISWDSRIKNLRPNQKVIIQKKSHHVDIQRNDSPCESVPLLEELFESFFSSLKIREVQAITLSGGWDSRVCAYYLKKYSIPVTAFSWGVDGSLENVKSDAAVAKQVARKLAIPFQFVSLRQDPNNYQGTLDTFIENGEGRTDHINGFLDGLNFWKHIANCGCKNVIRADEAFGWLSVSTESDTRISLDMNYPSDYPELKECFKHTELEPPLWPSEFYKKDDESLSSWRDRIYRNYRIPYILSALHEPMLSYVEISTPLLYPKFIHWAINQTDHDRTNKRAYKRIIKSLLPDIPPALIPAIPEVNEAMSIPGFLNIMMEKINTECARNLLGNQLIDHLQSNLKSNKHGYLENSALRKLKNITPFFIKKIIRKHILSYKMGYNRILLRAYIIVRFNEMIQKDITDR